MQIVNETRLLTEEAQLGEQLNQCVHSERRSDFALLLSMLTSDVRAHSQFKLPTTSLPELTEKHLDLRKSFELPKVPQLGMSNTHQIDKFNQAPLIANHLQASLHLDNYIDPKPIAFRDDAKHISSEVLNNTTLYCQQQHKNSQAVKDTERATFNAKAWLKAIQTTLVKAPLLEPVSA